MSSSSSHKSSSRDKDKDRHRDKDGKHSSSSSSSRDKDKERSERKEKERSSGDKDKDKEKSSRSSAGGSAVSSSSSSRDKDKDRHKSSSSSSSKNKHSSSSSSASKHRSSNSSSSHRHSSSSSKSSRDPNKEHQLTTKSGEAGGTVAAEPAILQPAIKVEDVRAAVVDNGQTISIKEEMNVSQASSCDYSLSQFNPNESQFSAVKREESDEDESMNNSHANNVSVKREIEHVENDKRDVSIKLLFSSLNSLISHLYVLIFFFVFRPSGSRSSPIPIPRTTFRFWLAKR